MMAILENLFTTNNIIFTVIIFLYILYYRKYRNYKFTQKLPFTKGRRLMGKTLPAFPNGWFIVARSSELKKGQSKSIDYHGQNIALFRGTDGIVYAIDAYCAHMGANLAEGGVVKYSKGLQCPFHGWVFDGSTGNCVTGPDMKPKMGEKYFYASEIGEANFTGQALKLDKKEIIKIKKWQVKELCGFIFIWYHAIEELRTKTPPYEPLDITEYTNRLSFRGTSINKVQSHIQDIPENGGDLMHFFYVHYAFLPFTDAFKARWRAKWNRADDPNLREEMKHEVGYINEFKMRLFDKYLNDENKPYIGIITLDSYMIMPGCQEIFFFNATGFQLGSGLVYLFLKGPFFETIFFQHLEPVEKFHHNIYHEIYASNYLPYWITALMLRLEAQQVMNDGKIWDNKRFAMSTYYNMNENADKLLYSWRTWFSQFYEGCKEAEEKREQLSW